MNITREPAPRRPLVTWRFLLALTVMACIPTFLGFMGRVWWRFELMSHFRVQYAWVLAAFTISFLVGKRFKSAVLPGAVALVNLGLILPLYVPVERSAANGATPLRTLSINLLTHNAAHEKVLQLVRETKPDAVLLLEVNSDWMNALEALKAEYPYVQARQREDNFGIALFSRIPLEEVRIEYAPQAEVPFVVARFNASGRTMTLIGAHTLPPATRRYARLRDQQMGMLASLVRRQEGPVVVIGDLNMTSWSPVFRDFVRAADLRDSRKGFGIQPTWPTDNPLLRIPIDHCLVSAEVTVVHREVGPNVGSDHFPLIVDFCVE